MATIRNKVSLVAEFSAVYFEPAARYISDSQALTEKENLRSYTFIGWTPLYVINEW